jgi:hypothetical protein
LGLRRRPNLDDVNIVAKAKLFHTAELKHRESNSFYAL